MQRSRQRGVSDPPTFTQWVEQNIPAVFDNIGKQILPELIENDKIGIAIIQMKWATIAITQGFPDFLTCDNPFFMSHGLGDQRCAIAVPLSPRFAFLATHNAETYNAVMAQGGTAFTKRLNALLVNQTQKEVYGSGKRHLQFVENRLLRKL